MILGLIFSLILSRKILQPLRFCREDPCTGVPWAVVKARGSPNAPRKSGKHEELQR